MPAFLKMDGVDGESTDSKHKGEIEVESFSWGATNVSEASGGSQGSGAAAGKVSMQDFSFVTKVSKASPTLFVGCASGRHFKSAELTVRKAGENQQEFLKVTMSDLLVSSYQSGGTGGEEVPTDQISLNFAKIEIFFKEVFTTDGTILSTTSAGWDLKTNSET